MEDHLQETDSRKLLICTNVLDEAFPKEFKNYVDIFNSFNEVVITCYSRNLDKDYRKKIDYFKKKCLNLEISVTPKVHAVIYHVSEFCELKGMGLTPWSEQTESLHHDFNQVWENYKVKDTNHVECGKRLLQAVQIYNSKHL